MSEETCAVAGCTKRRKGRTCSMHAERMRVHGSYDKPERRAKVYAECVAEGCEAPGSRADGLCVKHYQRRWHVAHWDETYARAKSRRESNRDAYLAAGRARYEANRELMLEQMRLAYLADPEPKRAAVKAWRKANPLSRNEMEMRRRAKMRGTQIGPVNYAEILAAHGMVCHICGNAIAVRSDLHFDHVVPLSRGGTHTADNILPAHATCNMRKHNRLPEEVVPGCPKKP